MTAGFCSGMCGDDLAATISDFSRGGGGGKMQHSEPLAVRLVPIKLALVVLRAERREQALRRARRAARPRASFPWRSRGALPVDVLRVLRCQNRRGERADTTEGQADARAVLRGVLRAVRSLVCVHAAHPARVGLEAHDEERVVRQRHALPEPRRPLLFPVTIIIVQGVLRLEGHGVPRTERGFTMREPRATSIVLSECSEM